ncbi:zinc finger hit domain containing protein [Anaeramoeba flamelloides]|uniref:Zinc finger hit domain containing protein n=1 Tax=Anaeramoeba flamelloides TaxID=1746091 RepID=A0ABQ8YXT8_9EUKA|nr:zinc finger hit domain containing protein [Anaeramoeba flamelloides]
MQAKYCCPSYLMAYCSLSCYKKHNLACTEHFYREQISTELSIRGKNKNKKITKLSNQTKQILNKDLNSKYSLINYQEEEEEKEEEKDSDNENEKEKQKGDQNTLSEIDIETIVSLFEKGQLTIEKLSPLQRKVFERSIVSGNLSSSIQINTPWWALQKSSNTEVKEVSPKTSKQKNIQNENKQEQQQSKLQEEQDQKQKQTIKNKKQKQGQVHEQKKQKIDPDYHLVNLQISSASKGNNEKQVLLKIPTLKTLLPNKKPSELLKYNLVDLIYCYAYLTRKYNCEILSKDSRSEISQHFLEISGVIGSNSVFKSAQQAIDNCLQNVAKSSILFDSLKWSIFIISDLSKILSKGKTALLRVIQEIKIITNSLKSKLYSKKLIFFQSWILQLNPNSILNLSNIIDVIFTKYNIQLENEEQDINININTNSNSNKNKNLSINNLKLKKK